MKKYLLIFIVVKSFLLSAQNKELYHLSGKVFDEKKAPVELATVRLLQNNKTYRYAITDSLGNFQLKNIKTGIYIIQIDFLGYLTFKQFVTVKTDRYLKPIILKIDAKALDEIVIKSYKQIVKPTNKGLVLQVAGTEMARKQSTTEILQIAPSVSLQNGLEILGDKHIKLTLNGQEVPIDYDKVLDFISKIKPRDIKKIEIIDNSNASFEGEQSAQINIYTNNVIGMNGGVGVTVFNNKYWGHHDEIMINYMRNRWQYFLYIDNAFHKSEVLDTIDKNIHDNIFHHTVKNQNLDRVERGVTANIGYELDSLKHISFLYDFALNNDENLVMQSEGKIVTPQMLDSIIQNKTNLDRLYHTHTLSLGYLQILDTLNSTFKINAGLAFTDYKVPRIENQFFYHNGQLAGEDQYQNDKIYSNIIGGLKVDWDKNFANNTELLIGGKWSQINIDDQIDYHYQGIDGSTHQLLTFLFRQNIAAIYSNMFFKWKKIQISTGLRSEFTDTYFGKNIVNENNRRYFRWLPNIKVSRKFNKKHYVYASFARKLNRPSYYQFNPEVIIYNKSERFEGNPDLLPVDIYRFQTGYYYKNQYAVNLRYNFQLDNIIYTKQYDETNKYLLSKPVNSGERINAVIDFSFPFHPYKWWTIYNKLAGAYSDYKTPIYPDNDFSSYYYYFSNSNQFRFNNFNMTLDANYMSKNKYLNTVYEPVFSLNWIMTYSTKNKKWDFYLAISDIFNASHSKYQSIYDGITINTYDKYLTRQISFGITYLFHSGQKTKNEETEDILDEEKNRTGR